MADFTTYPLEKFQANLIIAVGSLVHILHRQLSDCFEHLLNRFKKKMARGGRHPQLYLSFKAGMETRKDTEKKG